MKVYFVILKNESKLKIMEFSLSNFNEEDIEMLKTVKVKPPDKLIGITTDFEQVNVNFADLNIDNNT